MTCCWIGDKPLPEQMMTLLMHIDIVTQLRWVNSLWPSDTICRHRSGSTLVQVMACSWRHQATTWTNVDLLLVRSSDNHPRAISGEKPQPSLSKISLRITFLKSHSSFPGGNELMLSMVIAWMEATVDSMQHTVCHSTSHKLWTWYGIALFVWEHLPFLSYLRTEMAQVIKILPCGRQGSVYNTCSIPWLLMAWQHKEPGHQQLWYWPW